MNDDIDISKYKIGVLGAGQMGSRIGEVACRDHDVVFFDTEPEKAQRYDSNMVNYLQ